MKTFQILAENGRFIRTDCGTYPLDGAEQRVAVFPTAELAETVRTRLIAVCSLAGHHLTASVLRRSAIVGTTLDNSAQREQVIETGARMASTMTWVGGLLVEDAPRWLYEEEVPR